MLDTEDDGVERCPDCGATEDEDHDLGCQFWDEDDMLP